MGVKKALQVFGVEFASATDFFKTLGYIAPLSDGAVLKRYGSHEQLFKRRYKIDSDEQAKKKLLELMGQKEQPKEQNAYIDDGDPVMRCAHAYINGLINKGDNVMLDNLALAFGVDRNAVLQAVEQIKKGV